MSDTPRTDAEADFGWDKDALCVEAELAAMTKERDELQEQLDTVGVGIHSCHENCQRPVCVMRRERDKWHTHYRDEHKWRLRLQDAIGEEMKRRAELETELQEQCRLLGKSGSREAALLAEVDNLKKERDDLIRQWREREPQLRAAETDLSELQVAYGVLKRHADAMAYAMDWEIMSGGEEEALAAYRASQQTKP